MTPIQIESLRPELADFLGEFSECFGRSEPRNKLAIYVRGQLSDDRDRKDRLVSVPPPSEPDVRISRTRLSGWQFYLRNPHEPKTSGTRCAPT